MHPARYVGIDLAWKESPASRTGLAVVDDSGRLLGSGVARTDAEIDAWLDREAPAPLVVGVDAPLVVTHATGARPAERAIGRAYGRYRSSAYPAFRANPLFDPPRAELLAARHGWVPDPRHEVRPGSTVCLEVFPHAALIGLFELPERLLYKKGPDRRAGFQRLVSLIASLPRLRAVESPRWAELASIVDDPRPGDLNRIEDELDAMVCAHVAWLWHHRRSALWVYGDPAAGFIVAPPPPTHAPAPRAGAPGRARRTGG